MIKRLEVSIRIFGTEDEDKIKELMAQMKDLIKILGAGNLNGERAEVGKIRNLR